jgi:hypothetical protein
MAEVLNGSKKLIHYNMKETKIVELVIEDNNQELAIDAISLVSAPAIEQDFVFFGKEKNNLTFAKVDEEKRMLVSPALIPNKQIFRYDPNTDSDYYVYFSPETVRKASELYLKHNNHHKATYEHQDRVSGVLTVESWIKEGDSDKSKMYGFDLPNGTWFVKMRIENDDLWNKIKDGELKGLSIEGYFTNKFEQMQKKEPTSEEIRTALKELLSVQKVELSVVSDIADALKTGDEGLGKANRLSDNIVKLNTTLLNVIDSIGSMEVQLSNVLDAENSLGYAIQSYEFVAKKIETTVKELGISANDIDGYKQLASQVKKYKKAKDELTKYAKFGKETLKKIKR